MSFEILFTITDERGGSFATFIHQRKKYIHDQPKEDNVEKSGFPATTSQTAHSVLEKHEMHSVVSLADLHSSSDC